MLRVPVRFPRPAPRTQKTTSSPFDVWQYIEELRGLYAKLSDGIELVRKAYGAFKEIKQGPPGKPGKNGLPGRNGTNVTPEMVEIAVKKFLRQPQDGKSPTAEAIAEAMMKSKNFRKALGKIKPDSITIQTQGGDALDTDMLVVSVLSALEEMGVPIDMLPKLEQRFTELKNHIRSTSAWRGGGDTVVAGTGITITNTPNGNKQISAPGTGATLTPETPTGTIDGSNNIFTVTHEPVFIQADGNIRVDGFGYTYAAGTITMDPLLAPVQSITSFYNAT